MNPILDLWVLLTTMPASARDVAQAPFRRWAVPCCFAANFALKPRDSIRLYGGRDHTKGRIIEMPCEFREGLPVTVLRCGAQGTKPPAPDTLNREGAMQLAMRLQQYWHGQGYPAARFWAEPIAERFDKVGTYEIYRVVCNLVDGLPPRYRDEGPLAFG
jgi:hypothetical protein